MMYYRLALQNQHTSTWIWKSTVLTALDAVFQLLRVFRPLAPERARVFSACCKEELNEMLARENDGLPSGSVTAVVFLRAHNLQAPETTPNTAEHMMSKQPITVAPASARPAPGRATCLPRQSELSGLEQRRLDLEMGVGGDHDLPYVFTLAPSWPQLNVWLKLFARVQDDNVHPEDVFQAMQERVLFCIENS